MCLLVTQNKNEKGRKKVTQNASVPDHTDPFQINRLYEVIES